MSTTDRHRAPALRRPLRIGVASLLAFLLPGCGAEHPARVGDPAAASLPTAFAEDLPTCDRASFSVDTVATGLDVPWDLVFLPDGRVLVTERRGSIRLIRDGVLQPEPWAELDVYQGGEAGLMGIDIEPRYADNRHVFVATTVRRGNRQIARALNAVRRFFGYPGRHAVTSRVVRFTDAGARGKDSLTVVEDIPSGMLHAGGALRFGPDGRLYMGAGDAGVPELAGDPGDFAGSILALTPMHQGVLATGLRNVQGLDWHPVDGTLYATDHGPTGMLREGRRTGHDEVNAILPGGDYGWPVETGRAEEPAFRPPRIQWTEAIAPAGLAFWRGDSVWAGDLFVSALAARDLVRIGFDGTGAPACTERLFQGAYGRIRALRAGPDGALWVGTSNRDGRGRPGPADDLLLRITPASGQP